MPSAEDPVEAQAAPELAIPLRAGPLRLVFDRGALRWIRLGEREVLRGIYFALRGENWVTVPPELEELVIEAEPDAFRIRFGARHERGPARYAWEGRITGAADGRIEFAVRGRALTSFMRDRIGLCVLHPIAACAGRPCIVQTVDGDRAESAFPARVAPHQPFRNVRAILHEVSPGVEAQVRVEGETFETEDQCNWGDASFKTYGTPLHLPRPVLVKAGSELEQTATVSIFGISAAPLSQAAASVPGALRGKRNSTEPVVVRVGGDEHALPAVGLAGAERPLSAALAERLRPLRLAHLRADLRLADDGWRAELDRAAATAAAVGAALELALLLPDQPQRELASRVRELGARIASFVIFRAEDHVTNEGHVPQARAALAAAAPGALFAGGSDVHFAELNRRRPIPGALDKLVYSLYPQAHAFDDATIVESLSSLQRIADTIRSFAGGAPFAISPATLRPRVDKTPPAWRDAAAAPFTDDPRQRTPFAAAWTLGLVAAAAEAGFASLTLFELAGPRGVQDETGPYPILHALADVGALDGARAVGVRPRRPERIQALALRSGGRLRLFLANVTRDTHPVRVEGVAGKATRAALGESAGASSELELELGPHEIARLDVELG